MNLFPPDVIEHGLGENVQSPRPADWQGNLIADVAAWFQTTPGANPNPDGAALLYYANAGYDQFIKDVAAVRAANPTAAAQIDQARAAAGLDKGAPPPVVQPPVVQPPVVTPPPPRPPVVQPPIPIIDCYPGYMQVGDKCVPIPGWTPPLPKPVFGGPIYSNASGVANATLIGYLSDDPGQNTFTVNVGEKVPDNFVLVRAVPVARPTTPVRGGELVPIYTKQTPYPTAPRDMVGFLFGQDELDMPVTKPFNLKKGDMIPINWNEDVAFKVPEVTPLPGVLPSPATGGVGTLILAAAAAYLLGS